MDESIKSPNTKTDVNSNSVIVNPRKSEASFRLGSQRDLPESQDKKSQGEDDDPSYKEEFAKTMEYPSKKVHNNKIPIPPPTQEKIGSVEESPKTGSIKSTKSKKVNLNLKIGDQVIKQEISRIEGI